MKKILILFGILFFEFYFTQEKYYILFDNNQDKIVYTNYKGKKEIEGFQIYINKSNSVHFIPSDIKSNYRSNKITNKEIISRNTLGKIIRQDNYNKKYKYIVVVKNKDSYQYYFVDHIVRTIRD